MNEVLEKILKAIKDNTYTHHERSIDELGFEEFDYVDEIGITRDVLLIFSEYSHTKIEEYEAKLMELKDKGADNG